MKCKEFATHRFPSTSTSTSVAKVSVDLFIWSIVGLSSKLLLVTRCIRSLASWGILQDRSGNYCSCDSQCDDSFRLHAWFVERLKVASAWSEKR